MKFTPTPIAGAWIVELEPRADERGFFARSWCRDEFRRQGLNPELAQCSLSFNRTRRTLRGMHFQMQPHQEAKLVRCTRGAVHDVILDLRPDSSSFKQWVSVELSAVNHIMLYIPEDVAHGFQTLADESELFYQMSAPYHPESASGVRWDDPAFDIRWPLPDPILSDKDRNWPLFGKG